MTRPKNSNCIKIGRRLKQLRLEKHITQKVLSEFLGVEEPVVCNIEKGKRLPSTSVAINYEKYFKVPLEYILGLSNAKEPENQIISKDLGLSDQAIERLKFMQEPENKDKNYTDVINCIFDSDFDAKLWQSLYYYLFRDLEATNPELIQTRSELADISFSLGDKNCLNYKLPLNSANSINEVALHNVLAEIKKKLKEKGYRAKKLVEEKEADYTLLHPEK